MGKATKRPSKAAKAAKKILDGSKLLVNKNENRGVTNSEFSTTTALLKTSSAIKPRPDKKRA